MPSFPAVPRTANRSSSHAFGEGDHLTKKKSEESLHYHYRNGGIERGIREQHQGRGGKDAAAFGGERAGGVGGQFFQKSTNGKA